MPAIFEPRIAKKINNTLAVWVIVICSDHKLPWQDSYEGVGHASTSPESILHKIFVIIIIKVLINLPNLAVTQNSLLKLVLI